MLLYTNKNENYLLVPSFNLLCVNELFYITYLTVFFCKIALFQKVLQQQSTMHIHDQP